MDNKNEKFREEEISTNVLLQKIKSGEKDPRTLKTGDRQICVDALILQEGFKHAQAAQLLRCSERTISRDVDAINKHNSIRPSFEFSEKLVGKMQVRSEIHVSHLMRLARSNEGSVAERAQAEFLAWRVLKESMDKLQTLGYLPVVAQHIKGEFFYHNEEGSGEKDISELKKAVDAIEATAKETGTFDAETEEQIRQLKSKIEKMEIESEIDKLDKDQDKKQEDQNEPDKQ